MKIVITGCAGFIGLNFLDLWVKEHPEDKIIGIDSLTYAANKEEIAKRIELYKNLSFYHADIAERDAIFKIFEREKPDCVVNFAAETHVDRSIENADVFVRTNVLGTEVLLDASLKYGTKRFHQISTDEVYGDMPTDSNERFTEVSPLAPSSPYSASKAAADMIALSYFKTHGLDVTVSRCSNNYGKYQHSEKMIPHTTELLLFGARAEVYGDGSNIRDWIHVSDHCRAVEKIVLDGKSGEIYNIGGGEEISNLALVLKISTVIRRILISEIENEDAEGIDTGANIKSDITEEFANTITENVVFVPDRKGHDRKYSLDTSKIKHELSWTPKVLFDDGILDTVRWIKENF